MRTFLAIVVIIVIAFACMVNFLYSNAQLLSRNVNSSGLSTHSFLYIASIVLLVIGSGGVYIHARKPRHVYSTFLFTASSFAVSCGIAIFGFARMIFEALTVPPIQLSVSSLCFGVVAGLVWFVGSLAYWSNQSEYAATESAYTNTYTYPTKIVAVSPQPVYTNTLKVGADGELVEVAQSSERGEIALHGFGNQATQTVYLEFGRYQLEYAFTSEQPSEIILVSVDDIETPNQSILNQGGAGSKTFGIQFSGRYVFEVRCPYHNTRWDFRCRLL
jgi:hypothetical protein